MKTFFRSAVFFVLLSVSLGAVNPARADQIDYYNYSEGNFYLLTKPVTGFPDGKIFTMTNPGMPVLLSVSLARTANADVQFAYNGDWTTGGSFDEIYMSGSQTGLKKSTPYSVDVYTDGMSVRLTSGLPVTQTFFYLLQPGFDTSNPGLYTTMAALLDGYFAKRQVIPDSVYNPVSYSMLNCAANPSYC